MIIYFNSKQFPNTLEECFVNDDISKLERDIKYIPALSNQVVISDLTDEEDWEIVRDNWCQFIDYLICTIQENIEDADCYLFDGLSCMELFECEFEIIRNY